MRAVLPKLLDQYKLLGRTLGDKKADDAWVERLAETIYGGEPRAGRRGRGRGPGRGHLAGGGRRGDVAGGQPAGAARPRPRTKDNPGKPKGSVHGDSVGVHASDSANAWRNIARVSNPRNTVASLIVGAYHTAGQSGGLNKEPYPLPEQLEKVTTKDAAHAAARGRGRDQGQGPGRARCALVHRYGELGHRRGRSSTCCCATPSARTGRCTRRSTTAR